MLCKRFFDHLVKASVLAILLCGGFVFGQDSSKDMWKDPATSLMWATKDNGAAVPWNAARDYCTSLRLGGFSDWRLATKDELSAMYDSKLKKDYKIKGPIELSDSRVWSGSQTPSGDVWNFYFAYGGESPSGTSGHAGSARALCVRSAK